MLNLSGRTFRVKPTAVTPYFDKVQFWLKRPLDHATKAELGRLVGGLYVSRRRAARFDSSFIQRIELKQPSEEALRWVASRDDAYINRAEITLDYCFNNGAERDDAFDHLDRHLVRGWHGRRQLIKKFNSDNGRLRKGGQTRYDAGRSAPNLIAFYKEGFSRITGELNCLHFEWRANGGKALRSAGISSPSDLVGFDYRRFWLPRLKLFEVEPIKLGRLLRKNGWRSRPAIESRVKLERRLGSIVINGSSTIQELVDQYRVYPVRRILKPISTRDWLPKGSLSREDLKFVAGAGGYRGNGRSSAYIRGEGLAA